MLASEHRHLLEVATRSIVCACDACALRFQAVAGGRFKLIPRDAYALPGFRLDDAEWENLALPINLAFFFYHSPSEKMMALYPSPAGATESLLPLSSWRKSPPKTPVWSASSPTWRRFWSTAWGRRAITTSRRSINVSSWWA